MKGYLRSDLLVAIEGLGNIVPHSFRFGLHSLLRRVDQGSIISIGFGVANVVYQIE